LIELLKIALLAIVQGLAELLPVSSSTHVIVAEKLLGLDPSSAEMTLLLVMLHTGTMFAVIVYFWRAWKKSIFASRAVFTQQALRLLIATALTGAIYLAIDKGIAKGVEKSGYVFRDTNGQAQKYETELLFGNLGLIAAALAAAGVVILAAGLLEKARDRGRSVEVGDAAWIGVVQGICLPFRGFSRSGATISTGMLLGVAKAKAEEFSFALAVILTPAVVGRELWRLMKKHPEAHDVHFILSMLGPSLLGMVFAFLAGLLALKWLSRWLENGRWYLFGVYCLVAAVGVFVLHCRGF
jgi:undecaprenyl-diphosphatase